MNLVQLLVSNLDSIALLALVLQESESGNGKNGENGEVAYAMHQSLCFVLSKLGVLTENESDDAASKIDQSFAKLEEDVDDALEEAEDEVDRLQDEVAGSLEEGVDDFNEGLDEVAEGGDDGGHDCRLLFFQGEIGSCEVGIVGGVSVVFVCLLVGVVECRVRRWYATTYTCRHAKDRDDVATTSVSSLFVSSLFLRSLRCGSLGNTVAGWMAQRR
jgi:uncharacterized protein YjbJ (UPF0337 family)